MTRQIPLSEWKNTVFDVLTTVICYPSVHVKIKDNDQKRGFYYYKPPTVLRKQPPAIVLLPSLTIRHFDFHKFGAHAFAAGVVKVHWA
jgi:hypothetical protein